MNDKDRRIEAERINREQAAAAANKRKAQEEEERRKRSDAEKREREKQEENERQRRQREKDQERKQQQAKQSGKPTCFVGSTPILTPDGWQPISNLKQGDQVISYDKSAGTTTTRHIQMRRDHKPTIIWEVYFTQRKEPICTTKSHSFLTNRGWKRTSQLRSGDILTTVGGEQAVVASIAATNRAEPVFNLITEGECTFVVQGCVVHNFTYFRNVRVWWHKYLLSGRSTEPQNYAEVLN